MTMSPWDNRKIRMAIKSALFAGRDNDVTSLLSVLP